MSKRQMIKSPKVLNGRTRAIDRKKEENKWLFILFRFSMYKNIYISIHFYICIYMYIFIYIYLIYSTDHISQCILYPYILLQINQFHITKINYILRSFL